MVQTAENGSAGDAGTLGKPVGMFEPRRGIHLVRLRHTETERHVRAGPVVVPGPLPNDVAKVLFVEGNDPVKALTPERADEPFAEGVGPDCRMHPIGVDHQNVSG